MAIVTGPLHSDGASGKFANALVFGTWKGRKVVRSLVTPSNPKSAAQLGVRAMMKYLSQLWSSLSAGDKSSWDDLAAAGNYSAFNAYTGHNLSRWQSNKGPTSEYPAAEADTDLDADGVVIDGVILATSGHDGYATGSHKPDTNDASNAIAAILFRSSEAPTPLNWAMAVAIYPVTPGSEWTFTDSPLDAGTYHYKIALISDDGAIGALSAADNTAVVT